MISLTSLIDVFSCLIFFLISVFSASGEFLVTNKDIKLPRAEYARELKRSPIVSIFPDKVTLEEFQVGDNKGIESKIEESSWELPQLKGKLKEYKDFFESTHQGVKFPGTITVQADRGLPFLYVKRVLFTLVKEGYGDINLVVRGEASGRKSVDDQAGEG
jgi:biopolymer transport protein ExbD